MAWGGWSYGLDVGTPSEPQNYSAFLHLILDTLGLGVNNEASHSHGPGFFVLFCFVLS